MTSINLLPSIVRRAALGTSTAAALTALASSQVIWVNTTDDTVDANIGDGICADINGNCSLRAAVQEATAGGSPVVIQLDPEQNYALSIAGAGEDASATGDLDISTPITITGFTSIDGGGLDRIFDVQSGGRLLVREMTLSGGSVTDESGGAIRNAGTLIVFDSDVTGCSATGTGASGGALFNDGGTMNVIGGEYTSCTADRAGGAIESNAGTTIVKRASFSNNVTGPAPGNGGAFHLTGAGTVSFGDCTVMNNVAAAEGGGLWNSGTGFMTIDTCEITGNQANGMDADNGGGGVFNDGGVMFMSSSEVANNSAPMGSGSGGGILNNMGDLTIDKGMIAGNDASRAGGGVEIVGGFTDFNISTLNGNATGASPGNGGAVHLTGAGSVTFERCGVSGNTATAEGGGIWNSGTGTMLVNRSVISDNTASGAASDQGGGGAFNNGGMMTITRSTLFNNIADGAAGSGGGALNNGGDFTAELTRFSSNTAVRAGGGVEAVDGDTRLRGCTLRANSTGASPGNGGGLHLTGPGFVLVRNGFVTGNDASNEGGGLWNSSTGVMRVFTSTIMLNTAPVGPDLFNNGGDFTVDGVPVP